MNQEHIEQIRILESDVKALESRFDNHGIESTRVARVLERLEEHSRDRDIKVDEMFEAYKALIIGKKGIVLLFGIFMTIGTAILMLRELFKK